MCSLHARAHTTNHPTKNPEAPIIEPPRPQITPSILEPRKNAKNQLTRLHAAQHQKTTNRKTTTARRAPRRLLFVSHRVLLGQSAAANCVNNYFVVARPTSWRTLAGASSKSLTSRADTSHVLGLRGPGEVACVVIAGAVSHGKTAFLTFH